MGEWKDKEKEKAYMRKYAIEHKEKKSAYAKAYRLKNRDHLLEKDLEYRANHREEAAARAKAWYYANKDKAIEYRTRNYDPEKTKAYNEAYREKNGEKLRAYNKSTERRRRAAEWIKNNPQVNRDRAHRRRAKINNNPHEKINHIEIYIRDYGICGLCNQPVSEESFTIDHIVPISKGGAHIYSNVHIAHRSCNASKGAKTDCIIYSL